MALSPDLRRASIQTRVKLFPVLEKLGIELSHGQHTQQIRCPFHDDKRPSARLYQDTQRIYCFTCGKGWDVIGLVQGRQKLSFSETLDWFDQHFPPPDITEDLTGTLNLLLKAQPSKRQSFQPFYNMVEERLIASRHSLGLKLYSELLQALDLVSYQRLNNKLSDEEAEGYLKQILKRCH